MSQGKEFLRDEEASFVVERIKKALGPDMERLFDEILGPKGTEDLVRFLAVSQRCMEAREEKGLTVREAASLLKVPQYHLRGIEGTRGISIHPATLEKYIDFLGLGDWFDEWKRGNSDVYQRLMRRKGYR